MSKRIAILGSTGSIGESALEVIAHLGPPYRAVALSAHSRTEKLVEQCRRFHPDAIAVTDAAASRALKANTPTLYTGLQGLLDLVRRADIDIVLAAIVGAAGLPACLAAVESGKTLALANKEALVVAGSLLIPLAARKGVKILPVDSEHSAIFQAMACGRRDEVRRVILTASGGPFRKTPLEQMRNATLADALNHPTWRMGSKITIDSATMFNKALELIEACWLFNLSPDQIEIVIHPESIVHSMVEFIDGSVIAQLSPPDMKTPIQYALTYPNREAGCSRRIDFSRPLAFNFETPDFERFPALRLAYRVAEAGGTAGAVLNAANEVAVEAFMAGAVPFGEISSIVERTIDLHRVVMTPTLEELMSADRWARQEARNLIAAPAPR